MVISVELLLLLVLAACLGSGAPASVTVTCHVTSVTHVACHLPDIIRDQRAVNVSVTVNNCHEPVDVTFAMTGTDLSWNFTFVPNNQNERVLIPNVYMIEPIPPVPTYLYVREPREENIERNGSSIGTNITVQASLVAQLVQQNMWEEVEFFNHTFRLPAEAPHCPPLLSEQGTHFEAGHWLTKMLVLVAGLLAAATATLVVILKRQQLLRLAYTLHDRLALVPHEQSTDVQPQMNINGSHATSEAVARQTQSSSVPSNQPNVLDLKSTLDSSALRYFNEVYPDERIPKPGSVTDDKSASNSVGKPKSILFRMMKAKKEVEIGLKGISFEKLKEDVASHSNSLSNTKNEGSNFQQTSPRDTVQDSNDFPARDKTDLKFPLDDDFSSTEECPQIGIQNRSDSYTNVFETSDHGEDFDSARRSPRRENPKWKVNFNEKENNNMEEKGPSNKHRSFGYDSREYLDELEGATAVYPSEKITKKKRNKSMKIDKQKREKDNRLNRHERNGPGATNGRRSSLHGKTTVETIPEDSALEKKDFDPQGTERYITQKRRRRSNSPTHGKAIVQEALQNGYFDYGTKDKPLPQDVSENNTKQVQN